MNHRGDLECSNQLVRNEIWKSLNHLPTGYVTAPCDAAAEFHVCDFVTHVDK